MKLSPFQTLLNIFGPLKKQPFFQVHLNDLKSYIFFSKLSFFLNEKFRFILKLIRFVISFLIQSRFCLHFNNL